MARRPTAGAGPSFRVAELREALRVEADVLAAGLLGGDLVGASALVDPLPAVVAVDPIHQLRVVWREAHEAHVGREQDQLLDLVGAVAAFVVGNRFDGLPLQLRAFGVEKGESGRAPRDEREHFADGPVGVVVESDSPIAIALRAVR
jgi:hypothetical protein